MILRKYFIAIFYSRMLFKITSCWYILIYDGNLDMQKSILMLESFSRGYQIHLLQFLPCLPSCKMAPETVKRAMTLKNIEQFSSEKFRKKLYGG